VSILFHGLTNSFAILAWDTAVTYSNSRDTDVVRHQFIWISCIQNRDGRVFSEIMFFGISRPRIYNISHGRRYRLIYKYMWLWIHLNIAMGYPVHLMSYPRSDLPIWEKF
jgi:hypothetical protein